MYLGAEKRFGKEKLFAFLKKYSQHYLGTNEADTNNFFKMCEIEMGKDVREYFQSLLTSNSWKSMDIKGDILLLA